MGQELQEGFHQGASSDPWVKGPTQQRQIPRETWANTPDPAIQSSTCASTAILFRSAKSTMVNTSSFADLLTFLSSILQRLETKSARSGRLRKLEPTPRSRRRQTL
jgi:hypothetical protein